MRRNPYSITERGVPVISQFEDGRKGIFYKSCDGGFTDGEIDWKDRRKTASTSFVTRCVVVRTYLDRYFAVGEESVVNLGNLNPEPADFSALGDDKIKYIRYGREIPSLIIGDAWSPAMEISGDGSKVTFAHVDWMQGVASEHGAVPTLGTRNYFDAARQILSFVEPDAITTSQP